MSRRAVAWLAPLLVLGLGCERPQRRPEAFHVVDSLMLNGRFADALPLFAALRDSLTRTQDSAALWLAQVGWAETLFRTGRLDSSTMALDEARVMAGDDRDRIGRTFYLRSMLLHRRGKLDSALASAREAVVLAREVGNRALLVDAQSAYATVFSLSGRYAEAAAEAESALAGERRLGRPLQLITQRLNNLGVEYRHLGRIADAERVFHEGLAYAGRLPSSRMAMLLNGNMANLRLSTGRVSEALQFSEGNVRAAESFHDVQGLVVGNGDLGFIHLSAGNYAAARTYFERSIAANTPVRYTYGRITSQQGLGKVELGEGHAEKAATLLRQTAALADSTRFGLERITTRAALSQAELAAGRASAALATANEALAISDSVGDLQARLEALKARAAALEAIGRRREASAGYLEVMDLLESWRGRIALGDLRMGVAEPYWEVYEGAIRTLLAQGDAPAAFMAGERARARRLLELLAERDASRPAEGAAGALRSRIRVLAVERDGTRSDSIRADRERDIAAAVDSLAELERRDAAARNPAPVTVAALQAGLAGPGRVLLAYFWGDRDVYGWRLGADGVRAARLGSAAALGASVDVLRAMLETPDTGSAWREPARRAWAAWVAPLGPPPGADLLVVPDGPLAYVPFEVLIPAGDSLPLGASRRVAYGPSASVLHALTRRTPASPTGPALLAVGNPSAGGVPPAAGGEARSEAWRPLPHAEAEARAAYRLFSADGADLLVGRRATRRRWLALEPSRYRYLHFAAHAEVSDLQPARTSVLLADGPLDLAAIRALRLNADLVTLSACETALGQRVRGEGVIGLPHAFLAAGSGAVLVTLWRVDDRETAAFMDAFYQELHARHEPAEALRVARSRFAGRDAQHPAYWAPFVLIGVL